MAIKQILTGSKKVLSWPNKIRFLDHKLTKRILKPKGVKGIDGFIFAIERRTELSMSSDITDHYVEDNTTIEDHVAKKPIKIILSGFIGEIVKKKEEEGILGLLSGIQNKLSIVPAYLGDYTPQQLSIVQGAITKTQQTIKQIDNYIARIKNIAQFLPGDTEPETKQKKAYSDLNALWATNQIFFLETEYDTFENMIIENVTMIQEEETKSISDIVVTLKELRFSEIKETSLNEEFLSGRAQQQRQEKVEKGITEGKEINFRSVLLRGGGVAGLGVKKLMNYIISLKGD